MLATAYSHRWLLASLLRRELGARYAGSVSGAAWALIHPLALLAVYAFVFTSVFRVQLPAASGGASYTAFAAIVLWPWIMFSEGVLRGMTSVGSNGDLIKKVAFPHALLVYAAVLGAFALHAVGYLAVLLVLKALGEPLHLASLPLVIFLLAPLALIAVGVTAILAALQTLLRDVEQVITVLLQVLFYGTPILYPLALVPESLRAWVGWNPLAWLAERLRDVLLGGGGLVVSDAWLWVIGIAVWWAGLAFFERLSPHFEDYL
jgi:ABC-type polysaccharide/polyol phosphate export permease